MCLELSLAQPPSLDCAYSAASVLHARSLRSVFEELPLPFVDSSKTKKKKKAKQNNVLTVAKAHAATHSLLDSLRLEDSRNCKEGIQNSAL